jgi:hypothetical protein
MARQLTAREISLLSDNTILLPSGLQQCFKKRLKMLFCGFFQSFLTSHQWLVGGYASLKTSHQWFVRGYGALKTSHQWLVRGYASLKTSHQWFVRGYVSLKTSHQWFVRGFGVIKTFLGSSNKGGTALITSQNTLIPHH